MSTLKAKSTRLGTIELGLMLLGTILSCSPAQPSNPSSLEAKPPRRVTIFVHGTILPFLTFVSPQWFLYGDVSQTSSYAQTLKRVRNDKQFSEQLFENTPMAQEGLVQIPRTLLKAASCGNLPKNKASHASYYILSAYDSVARMIDPLSEQDEYALFGWSGMITQSDRKKAAENFYNELCTLRDHYKALYNSIPEFHIAAWSHGGNVALLLDDIEHEQNNSLSIEILTLWGVPFQTETAKCITSPLFKNIISFNSRGDTIAPGDAFSTEGCQSFTYMSDLVDLARIGRSSENKLYRADISLFVNGRDSIIDHYNMFLLGWHPVCNALGKLPAVVLAPALVAHAQSRSSAKIYHWHAHINNNRNQELSIYLQSRDHRGSGSHSSTPQNLFHAIDPLSRSVNQSWHPRKNITDISVLKDILQTINVAFSTHN